MTYVGCTSSPSIDYVFWVNVVLVIGSSLVGVESVAPVIHIPANRCSLFNALHAVEFLLLATESHIHDTVLEEKKINNINAMKLFNLKFWIVIFTIQFSSIVGKIPFYRQFTHLFYFSVSIHCYEKNVKSLVVDGGWRKFFKIFPTFQIVRRTSVCRLIKIAKLLQNVLSRE